MFHTHLTQGAIPWAEQSESLLGPFAYSPPAPSY